MFALTQQEADASDDMVAGTIHINGLPAYALFDCGVTNTFLSQKFYKALYNKPDRLDEVYQVGTLGGKILRSDLITKDVS